MRTHCKQPDRHVPGIECGYPIPCPYHTIIITEEELLGPLRIDERIELRWAQFFREHFEL